MRINRVTLLAYAHLLANQRDARARATRPTSLRAFRAFSRGAMYRYEITRKNSAASRLAASRQGKCEVRHPLVARGLKLCSRSD